MATRTKVSAQSAAQGDEAGQSRPPLGPDLLKRLYSNMLKCRLLEEQVQLLMRKGGIACSSSATVGLEATIVGSTIDLRPEDAIAPSRPGLYAHVMNGTPLQEVFATLPGCKAKKKPAVQGTAPHAITPASVVAANLNVGVGMALAYRLQKKLNVVVALSDDTSASLDAWHEALTFAGRHRLPVVFVVENNLWQHSDTVGLRDEADLSVKAQAYGFPVITVDGNDVVAVYRVCYEARERARQGYGPTLVESRTWRWYGHADADPAQHRGFEDIERWKASDPIPSMECYLQKQSLWDDRWKQQLVKEFKSEIRQGLQLAKTSRCSSPEDALKVAYSL